VASNINEIVRQFVLGLQGGERAAPSPSSPAVRSPLDDLTELYRLIKHFEGCRLMPYLCPGKVWTCGWGSTGADVYPGRVWTQTYADRRMEQDAVKFAKGTLALCPALRAGALNAIADFAYNLGLGNLQASTLRRVINGGGTKEEIAHQLSRWVNAGGRRLRGLELRRAAEAALL
jgi:lysozyme